MGLVDRPRHVGSAAAVRRPRRAPRRLSGRWPSAPSSRSPVSTSPRSWSRAWPPCPSSTTTPPRRPRGGGGRDRRRPGRADRLLHGRHVHAQGGPVRPLRPHRRLLRDDPRAGELAQPEPGRATRPPRRRPSRAGAGDHRRAATRTRRPTTSPALEATGVTVVRYPDAEHGFAHDPEPSRPPQGRRRRRLRPCEGVAHGVDVHRPSARLTSGRAARAGRAG